MKIILAKEKHIPGIIEVWKEFMEFHKNIDSFYTIKKGAEKEFEKFIREIIVADDAHSLVALDRNQIIGFSISRIMKHPPVFEKSEYGKIIDLAVKEEYRRQGVGEEMLSIIFEWFDAHDIKRIELKVASKNKVGYSFWEKHGFMDYIHVLHLER